MHCSAQKCAFSRHWPLVLIFAAIIGIHLTHTNQSLFYTINAWHIYLPDSAWNFINLIAYSRYFILASILVVLTLWKRRDKTWNTLFVIAAYYIIFFILKHIIHEPRPFIALDPHSFFWINQFENTARTAYESFPSGHAGNMAMFVFSLNYLFFQKKPWARTLLIGLLVLTMLSRICSGWHWPIDVLTSVFIGFIIVKIGYSIPFCRRFSSHPLR